MRAGSGVARAGHPGSRGTDPNQTLLARPRMAAKAVRGEGRRGRGASYTAGVSEHTGVAEQVGGGGAVRHAHGRPTVVVCPMEIEAAAVRRGARGVVGVEVIRSGIGKEAIVRAVEARAGRGPVPGLVILAGVCGALRPVDDVPPIARVIDEHGGEWTGGIGMVESGRTLVAVDRVVSTPGEKRALADATGAALVDMESHAFAAACERLGLAWGVVRGVSDTPEETLPGEVLGWITADGRTRVGRAVADMVMKPGLIPHMRRTLARSKRVLPMVAARVMSLHAAVSERGRGVEA